MVEIQMTYDGELRCTAIHGPSGHSIRTDAPADNHGRAELFSPTDLVVAALGNCMLTVMGIYAAGKIDITGATVKAQKQMTTSPPRRIAQIIVDIHLPARLTPEERKKLERVALACPVHHSLHPETEMPVTFHYDVGV